MTKKEFIDLVKTILPGRGINRAFHSMTIEKLASVVYLDILKQYGSSNPNSLSAYRRPYPVTIVNNTCEIPVDFVALPQNGGGVLVKAPDNTLMFVPVGEEESILLNEIDVSEIDPTISYYLSGGNIHFLDLPDSITEVTLSVIPTLDALSDDEQINLPAGSDVAHLTHVLQLLIDSPEKQVNDRNKNTI